jgi:hypothetical protein
VNVPVAVTTACAVFPKNASPATTSKIEVTPAKNECRDIRQTRKKLDLLEMLPTMPLNEINLTDVS